MRLGTCQDDFALLRAGKGTCQEGFALLRAGEGTCQDDFAFMRAGSRAMAVRAPGPWWEHISGFGIWAHGSPPVHRLLTVGYRVSGILSRVRFMKVWFFRWSRRLEGRWRNATANFCIFEDSVGVWPYPGHY